MRHLVTWAIIGVTLASSSSAQELGKPGQQVEGMMSSEAGELKHLLYLPAKYDDYKETSWPVVIFLHGRGESYGPLGLVAKWGPPRFAQRGDELPYVLVSPQCPGDGRWSDEVRQKQLSALLDATLKQYRVDPDRVYLTGLSMGGYGSWTWAAREPQRFAAVVPICGGGNPDDADALKDLPIWVFHGDRDGAVPFQKSEEMVNAIREAGSKTIRFTSLEHVGHNSWTSAYALPELYGWLLKQQRKADAE